MKLTKVNGKWVVKKAEEVKVKEEKKLPLLKLSSYIASLQVAHWQADTATNEHKALGDLYSTLSGLLDDFAEVYMGIYGVIKFSPQEMVDVSESPCKKGLDILHEIYMDIDEEDCDLENIHADMKSALHKAKYLLKEK